MLLKLFKAVHVVFLLEYFKKREFKYPFFIAFFLIGLTIGLNLFIPVSFKYLVNYLIDNKPSSLSVIISYLIASYSLLWLISQTIVQLREIILFKPIEQLVRLFSIRVFTHLQQLSMQFHITRKTGAMITSIERAQEALPKLFWGIFLYIIPVTLEIVGAIIILWGLYNNYYCSIFLLVLFLYFFISAIGTEWSSKAQRESNHKTVEANSRIIDSLLNIETIKFLGTNLHEITLCNQLLSNREKAEVKKKTRMEIVRLSQSVVVGIGLIIMTWVTVQDVIKGIIKVSDFILINGYFMQFVNPLSYFGHILQDIRNSFTNLEAAIELLEIPSEPQRKTTKRMANIEVSTVLFENVNFGYDKSQLILKNVSFRVNKGKMIAIVGPSGTGKSTIGRLLSRLYIPIHGKIKINSYLLNTLSQSYLHKIIGVIPQDISLFNDTLYYNITYAAPSASLEEIQKVIKIVQLDNLINSLPEGLETKVGERGERLSGGERQRLAIARILLKKPQIYIFDEATSALDAFTEQKILANMKDALSESIIITITHRLSTIVNADEIIVINNGEIVEIGDHHHLLNLKGLYHTLWKQQSFQ